jgi:hypothetical protein
MTISQIRALRAKIKHYMRILERSKNPETRSELRERIAALQARIRRVRGEDQGGKQE